MQFRKRVNLGLVEGPLNYRSKLWKSLSASLFQPITGMSVYQDSTRTTLASVGDAVGALNSLTNSDVTTQATTSFKPQLLQSGSGNNYLSLDGVNDSLPVTIPNGAWVADMTNINYLTNSNTATNNTIVDYLGNTITLGAGEIGWNWGRRVENLYKHNGIDGYYGYLASAAGKTITYSTPGQSAFYKAHDLQSSTTFTLSFVALGIAGQTINIGIGASDGTINYIKKFILDSIEQRYSHTFTTISDAKNYYFFIDTRTFSAEATSATAETITIDKIQITVGANTHEYVDNQLYANSGLKSIQYFDTYNANTVNNNVVTEATGAKLPTPPTIKVNAGDSLAISPKYTARTIVDYLGNTVTLKAGEIGWNGARRLENIIVSSDNLNNLIISNNVGATILSDTTLQLLNVSGSYFYRQTNAYVNAGDNIVLMLKIKCSVTRKIGIRVTNQAQQTPAVSNDVSLVADQETLVILKYVCPVYSRITFGIDNRSLATTDGTIEGIFTVTNIAIYNMYNYAGNVTDFVSTELIYNAGVKNVRYFDTDATGAKLPGPITPNTTGVFTAMAYSPSTPAQSDRDKIDAYIQNQGVKL